MNPSEENQGLTGIPEQAAVAPQTTPPVSSNGAPPAAAGPVEQEIQPVVEPPVHEPDELQMSAGPEPEPEAPPRESGGIKSLLATLTIVLFIMTFVVQAFQIPSQSMEKTLLVGDYLLVDKIHFGETGVGSWFMPYSGIKRGDIVVFHYPIDTSQHFVKRVIGVPGDRIHLDNKTVFVNGVPQRESYVIHKPMDYSEYRDNFPAARDYSGQTDSGWRSNLQKNLKNGELVVPKDQYFVMGDNRDESLDSRFWGFVPRDNIVGRPLVIYLSLREEPETRAQAAENRFFRSRNLLAHGWQFARWDRMFHLVR